MPKFLVEWKYDTEGLRALQREGGSARRDAVRQTIESAGGRLENYCFAFGDSDGYLIADLPGNEAAAAVSIAASSSGTVETKVVALLTPEEIDAAVRRSVEYRAPRAA